MRIGGDIHVTLLNQSPTEDEAVAVQDALVIVNSAGRTALSEARQLIVSQPEPPNLELLMAIDRLDELLEHLVIARQGAQVHVTAVIGESLVPILSSGLGQASEVVQKTDARKTSLANLKQIVQGFQNYHNTYRSFPQAVQIGPKNAPRSWRVTLLPFLGYKELHGEYRQDEPWDSEHNRTILAKMPDVYRCPVDKASSTNSSYLVFIGPETVFTGNTPRNYAEITDGMANTLLVVECKRDVPWTKPDEIAFDPKQRVPDLGGWYPEGFHAATCAGDTQFFPLDFDETILKYLIMPRDRHPAQMPQAHVPVVPRRSAR